MHHNSFSLFFGSRLEAVLYANRLELAIQYREADDLATADRSATVGGKKYIFVVTAIVFTAVMATANSQANLIMEGSGHCCIQSYAGVSCEILGYIEQSADRVRLRDRISPVQHLHPHFNTVVVEIDQVDVSGKGNGEVVLQDTGSACSTRFVAF